MNDKWLHERAAEMLANPTKAEKAFACRLSKMGVRFEQQKVIAPYIVDFFLVEQNLIVELDGSGHKHRREKDAQRDRYLRRQGHKIIRIPNKKSFRYSIYRLLTGDVKEKVVTPKGQMKYSPNRVHPLDWLDDLRAIQS